MTPIQRLGLTVATGVAALAVASAFVVDGYFNAQQLATQPASAPQAETQTAPAPTDTLGPQTIYVKPVPSAPQAQVVQTAPPAPDPTAPVIHIVVPGGGESDEGQGDD